MKNVNIEAKKKSLVVNAEAQMPHLWSVVDADVIKGLKVIKLKKTIPVSINSRIQQDDVAYTYESAASLLQIKVKVPSPSP